MGKSISYLAGFIVGILVVLIISLYLGMLRKKKGLPEKEYDERQILARGQAYKSACITLMIYLYVVGFFEESFQDISRSILMYIGFSLGALAFGIVVIVKDAYMPVLSKPLSTIVWLFVAAGLNLFMGVRRIEENFLNLCFGVVIMLMVILYIAKYIYERIHPEEE